ncbi:MAG: hypothetical protein OER80_11335 [Gammaproteobacteria bacterium]|nr:hypothetical protein [Gammaproteobacteria bacterium]MDH3766956.1 hypothetical protein [Gammaproteobacteria bacterium]
MFRLVITVLVAATLSGCLAKLTGDHYGRHEARVPQKVTYGTVERLRLVQIEGTKSRIGPIIGAIIGGEVFKDVGDGHGGHIMETVGAAAGGVAGAAAEEGVTRRGGVEISVMLRNGDEIAVVQEIDPRVDFRVGDNVRVLFLDGYSRVVPDV